MLVPFLSVVVAAALVGSLASCRLSGRDGSGCSGTGDLGGPLRTPPAEHAAPGRPPAVAEALWVADESGTLRAIDGRTNAVSASVEIGRSVVGQGADGQPIAFGPALFTGGGLIWAFRYDGEVALVDPARARIVRRATVTPAKPLADNTVYYAHGALWIAQPGRLWRVRPSGEVASVQLPPGVRPVALAATARWLWLAGNRRLIRVDPAALRLTVDKELPVAAGVGELLGTRTGLFAVGWNQPQIWALDPDTAAVRFSIPIADQELVSDLLDAEPDTAPAAGPGAKPAADAGLWAIGNCGNVMKVTGVGGPRAAGTGSAPARPPGGRSRSPGLAEGSTPPASPGGTPQVRKFRISDVSQTPAAAVALGSLWVCDEVRSELVRVDARTGTTLARLPVGAADPDDPAFAVVAGEQSVWLVDTNLADGAQRVDPATNRVLRLTPSAEAPSPEASSPEAPSPDTSSTQSPESAAAPVPTGVSAVVAAPPDIRTPR